MDLLRLPSLAWHLCTLHVARLKYWYASAFILLVLVGGMLWYVFLAAPWGFPAGQIITVASGESVNATANELSVSNVIASTLAFKVIVRLTPGAHGVESGVYAFPVAVNVFTVAWHLTHGIAGIPSIRVTFPEGITTKQMGALLSASIPNFGAGAFDTLAAPDEGYLFPDTYFFLPATTESEAVDLLHDNYETHIARYAAQIAASGRSEQDIVTMASLLEGEAKTTADRRIIAGILWNRLAHGMPLQVDATFAYLYATPGYVPTAADLKSDSPYNTYRHKGLPPTPINNPGDDSIEAALTPTATDYVYYLTGADGQMHYAKTLSEQHANEKKYLK